MAREGGAEDLTHCHALHESARPFNAEAGWRILPELWRSLLSSGGMQLFLVEDRANPPGSRIVSFSITVFVTDEFCREARSTLSPYLDMQLTRQYVSRTLRVLTRGQVAQANACEGLNVMICFGSSVPGLSQEQILAVHEKQNQAFYLAHGGYRVKEFLAEPIGEAAFQWMLDAGANLRRDYSDYFKMRGAPLPESSQRPWLVGLTKEEALSSPGSYLSSLFVHTPPRFYFNRSEQVLLRHALMGKTCEELATSLFISPWTVKKRWRAIYERVVDVDRELLLPIAHGPDPTSRGIERRRHLLHYLRQHLEELRPLSR